MTTGNNPDLRFPGQWFQAESGLFQNWMRDYDPTLGRYLQADSLGLVDGPSIYGYALQNPQRYTDPRGECAGPAAYACAAAAGAVAGVAVGYMTDMIWGDGCYTLEEALFDAGFGAVGGAAFKAAGAVWGGVAGRAVGAASRGPGEAIRDAAVAARAAGRNPRDVGRAAHDALRDWGRRNKPDWTFEGGVRGSSGRTRFPDVRTSRGRNIDLKPNTASGRRSGRAKQRAYEREGIGRTRIIYY